jgi:hypothetical protein
LQIDIIVTHFNSSGVPSYLRYQDVIQEPCSADITFKIGQEIGNLNDISSDVVGALDSIKNAIQNVAEYVSPTAAAIEEQGTVTGEMSSSMSRGGGRQHWAGGVSPRTESVGWAKRKRAHH